MGDVRVPLTTHFYDKCCQGDFEPSCVHEGSPHKTMGQGQACVRDPLFWNSVPFEADIYYRGTSTFLTVKLNLVQFVIGIAQP